ncbi:MAG: hypothetical protein H0T43_06565 [Solirubrobacterales bacterium]|nr:hypothetical protein [Solirubrobacterales bacterium]
MARGVAAMTALLAVAALAGCGADDAQRSQAPSAVQPVGDVSGGSVTQFADCGDWRAGTRAERFATIEVLRGQLTPQRSQSAASPLADERAYEVFQKACSPDYAESLRLYKLYVRVQGFSPLSR